MSSERDRRKLANRIVKSFEAIYTLTNHEGVLIADDFQKLPLRTGTDYYKFISRPISLHTIGRNVKKFSYETAQRFVDDIAQVTWNARHYNEPSLTIYENALLLDQHLKEVIIPRLSQDRAIPNHGLLYYPDLGPLEEYGAVLAGSATPLKDDLEDPLAVEDFGQLPAVQFPQPYKGVGGIFGQSNDHHYQALLANNALTTKLSQREHLGSPYGQQTPKHMELGIRRGRPPIIDKPYETRIKAILKQFKKLRHPEDESFSLTAHFERLPDKNMESYYDVVANPISLHEIRVKVRSRKYSLVDQFLSDLSLMFDNAKHYFGRNQGSQVYQDMALFEQQAQAIIQVEMLKSDQELLEANITGTEGLKTPLDSVEVNGYLYKIGDWVLILNPNDANKPTAGQIFRLWSTEDGTQYTNVCWYIRPEQTCHRYDRLFYSNEVCKTGEYRDHLATDIVGPCYVFFLTHYQKGDLPQGLVPDGCPWFICEFRYNANSHIFNRIRTWKACLPDEIRHIEQPIVPIHEPRKLIKYDSPIKHLLLPHATTDMEIPPPQPGVSKNGPPIVGSVYLRDPIGGDELGQCSTSPNVTPCADHDDPSSSRKAYLFTPISQLKGGGGSGGSTTVAPVYSAPAVTLATSATVGVNTGLVNSVPGTLPAIPMTNLGSIVPAPAQKFEEPPAQQDLGHLRYRQSLQQQQYQYAQNRPAYAKPDAPSPARNTPPVAGYAQQVSSYGAPAAPSHFHATSKFSNLLSGGILAYTIPDEDANLAHIGAILRPQSGQAENTWYRAPPVMVSSRIAAVGPVLVGHSAKYLAWKLQQKAAN